MQKLLVVFRKGESARFLSHLDLTATLEYAVRRARLPMALSEGFNPRPRLSVAASLALGYVGEAELLEILLREPVDPVLAGQRLQAVLPSGLTLISVEEADVGVKSAAARLQRAVYRVDLGAPVNDLVERIQGLLRRGTIELQEQREAGVRRRDVRPMILGLHALSPASFRLEVRLDRDGSLRPEQVVTFLDLPLTALRITRERIVLAP